MSNSHAIVPTTLNDENRHTDLLREAILHIKANQERDGSFVSLSSFFPDEFSDAIPYRTTFFTSTILSCLNEVRASVHGMPGIICAIKDIQERASRFLLEEKSAAWSWNYWASGAKERETMSYADDLDDTFSALAALSKFNSGLAGGKALAGAVKLLTELEVQEGGPYRTWIVSKNAKAAWKDIDLAVNSNIAYFLSLAGVRLPNICSFTDEAIQNNRIGSPYYPSAIHVAYFISRFYEGNYKKELAQIIAAHIKEIPGSTTLLERAMVISALANLGFSKNNINEQASSLLQGIESFGWQPYAFCIDPSREGKTCYAGASALTAAFCAEAIAKYEVPAERTQGDSASHSFNAAEIHKRILGLAQNKCSKAGGELADAAQNEIGKTTDRRITLLAYHFGIMLEKQGKKISPDTIEQLSLANLYGWMAYRIYDDLEDNEGNASILPAANLFLRALCGIYRRLDEKISGSWRLLESTMDRVDNANAWEQEYCRTDSAVLPAFGDYANLAERSIGHAMGPLTELLAAGYAPDSEEYAATETFFRHYLIARQMNDDAHDWERDLARGRVNSIATLVLQLKIQNDATNITQLAADIPSLRQTFWTKTIGTTVMMVHAQLAAARAARENSHLLGGALFMEDELGRLERAIERARDERNAAMEFIGAYKR